MLSQNIYIISIEKKQNLNFLLWRFNDWCHLASWVKFQIKEILAATYLVCILISQPFSSKKNGRLSYLCQLGQISQEPIFQLLKWHSFIRSWWIDLFNPLITISVHHKSLLVYQKRLVILMHACWVGWSVRHVDCFLIGVLTWIWRSTLPTLISLDLLVSYVEKAPPFSSV